MPAPARQDLISRGSAVARRQGDWTTWDEARIKVFGLTPVITTHDLWRAFSSKGTLFKIELFEDSHGTRDGKALLCFRPPPKEAFWQVQKYPIYSPKTGRLYVGLSLEPSERKLTVSSPVNSSIHYPQIMTLHADSVDFGVMYNATTMLGLYEVAGRSKDQMMRLNLHRKTISIEFRLEMANGKYVETFRFNIPLSELKVIYQTTVSDAKAALVISLDHPPCCYRKIGESESHEEGSRLWYEDDAWFRQTDILEDPAAFRRVPTALRKSGSVIDLGRWTTYRLVFNTNNVNPSFVKEIGQALQDFNVKVEDFGTFEFSRSARVGWAFVDQPLRFEASSVLEEMMGVTPLAFPVRYQLEVCISQGLLNEYNLSEEFALKLRMLDQKHATDLLVYIATENKRYYDPMDVFSLQVKGTPFKRSIPAHCVEIRSATVTPTTMYFHNPSVEVSNRIIRQFAGFSDRFLRVRFSDEKYRGGIYPTPKDTMNEVFTRIKRTMTNGIIIGDRHYEFLAFGNSQFRQHGAYFFASLPDLSCNQIRNWMGKFSGIKEIAKFSARIGQCLSTTRAIHGTKVKIIEVDEVERNGYTFTDGVGKISPFVAQVAANDLGITSAYTPSAFQFRLGGCKGVLAVAPDIGFREVGIRESQYKFPAKHEGLEIIRCSQFIATKLNRQLILVLSALGVPDQTFMTKLEKQLSDLDQALEDGKIALSMLQRNIDHNQMTLALAGMILDGFHRVTEPFMMSLLYLWRAWSIKYLKDKAQISIDEGALLLGVIDETSTLQGHYDVSSNDREKIPEIFVQICRSDDEGPQVMTGPMLLARNPSLHPGDIRVVRGVDVSALHHLKNVVVLPQTGDRDVASMCSGGDLDGDDFLVIWDHELLPQEWNHPAMDYTAPEPLRKANGNVTMDDITSFFVNYMKNDTLPSIALAHVAWADDIYDGVKSEKCLRLASLHSQAVDYFKTGQAAVMSRNLRPKRWPHFMEKQRDNVYISRKILGRLYDRVEKVDFQPHLSTSFDDRITNAYPLDSGLTEVVSGLKKHYDEAIRRIMAQHDIETEYEVWSTFVLHHSNEHKDFKFHEVIGELSSSLKDTHRRFCYEAAGGKDFSVMGPFVAAMYTVTAQSMTQYLEEKDKDHTEGQKWRAPLISFPWLFQSILGKIAMRNVSEASAAAPETAVVAERFHPHPAEKPKLKTVPSNSTDDVLENTQGDLTHRGEELKMFGDLIDLDATKGSSSIDEHPSGPVSVTPTPSTSAASATASKTSSSAAPATVDELLGLQDLDSLALQSDVVFPPVVSGEQQQKPIAAPPLSSQSSFSGMDPGVTSVNSVNSINSISSAKTPTSEEIPSTLEERRESPVETVKMEEGIRSQVKENEAHGEKASQGDLPVEFQVNPVQKKEQKEKDEGNEMTERIERIEGNNKEEEAGEEEEDGRKKQHGEHDGLDDGLDDDDDEIEEETIIIPVEPDKPWLDQLRSYMDEN